MRKKVCRMVAGEKKSVCVNEFGSFIGSRYSFETFVFSHWNMKWHQALLKVSGLCALARSGEQPFCNYIYK